jgi:simple sugar transport system substrate-binding protein
MDAQERGPDQSPDEADGERMLSRGKLLTTVGAAALGAAVGGAGTARATTVRRSSRSKGKPVYYWISHGDTADQIWVIAQKGASRAGSDLGVTVRTSFHQGDVASHKEAFGSAIAAHPAGIASTSPQPGALKKEIASATARGIPVIMFNTDDPNTARLAYVGADLYGVGVGWANYLVAKKFVKKGDFVWMPVEVPGATYQVVETQGVASVFKPRGIKYEVTDASADPAKSLSAMTDYITAHGSNIKAVIGLGDLVAGNIEKAFKAAGIKPGRIPAVGWGNTKGTADAVKHGYVNAATWQYPDSQGYQPIVLLNLLHEGLGAGYDIPTQALYNKTNVNKYSKYLR